MQDIVTRELNRQAKAMGYYSPADIMQAQNDIADNIILENLPVGILMPEFENYLEKVNYIIACEYPIYAKVEK